MIVTHKINMNLDRAGVMPRVDVVQGDANTREIQFSLFSGGEAWEIPADAQVLVRYRKASGAGGTYDTLPDAASASVVSGNTVTITLAPQVLTQAGSVSLAVTLVKGEDELSTFSVLVNAMKNPTAAVSDDGNYVSVAGMIPGPESAQVGQHLEVESVDENGKITAMKAVDAPSGELPDGIDYADVQNKPKINGVELDGDKSLEDLGISAPTGEQIASAVEDYMAENPVEVDIPAALPNPNALTFTGAVSASYDGSKPVVVPIPQGGAENAMTDILGYSGIHFYDNGNTRAYNPIVNTTAWNERCRKVSALMQKAAESAELASEDGVMAHESSMSFYDNTWGILSWVENVAGTAADVPTEAGITCVKGRAFSVGMNRNFPSAVPTFTNESITVIAQKGENARDTLKGEDFTLQGGVGYQTSIDGKVLCGYVSGYAKLSCLTCTLTVSGGVISVSRRDTWTLTIDGVLGEYNYSRLPAGLTGATLHPSNQVAKIGSTYYRADVVPNNGFVVFNSTDLINWTYIGHATFPEGFADKSATEACCGAKRERLYVAVRQAPESACLYLAKMNADMHTVNSCVALPDCGSKPCFVSECSTNDGRALLLATAPADRYGCRVYNIPTDYNMTHIYPMFELHGVACNYPFVLQTGVDPSWVIIAGTNGAQTNKKGVSLVPAAVYAKIAGQVGLPNATDNIVHNADGAVAFGGLYDALT